VKLTSLARTLERIAFSSIYLSLLLAAIPFIILESVVLWIIGKEDR
jgi:hypothetical protein